MKLLTSVSPAAVANVTSLTELATVIEDSGWGNPWETTEVYQPQELMQSLVKIQAFMEEQESTESIWQLPRMEAVVDALNLKLAVKIDKPGGKVNPSCLPVGLIFWIQTQGLKRMADGL